MENTDTGHLALKSVDVFEGLPEEVLKAIGAHMEKRRADAGSVIFAEGDDAIEVFVIRNGVVQITKLQDGNATMLARRGRGELIGEMALLDASPRFATAICETDCELLALSCSRFFQVLAAHPAIAERIMRVMSSRVREADVKRLQALEVKARELEAARARLEAALTYRDRVLAFSPYPIAVTDKENRIRLVNHAAQHLFGHPSKTLLWEWLIPRDQSVPEQAEERLAKNSSWHCELELLGPDQSVLLCKMIAVPIADTGDGRAARLWILEDQTEMRALQQRAVDRERLAVKGEMAGEIAHEINNFLAVLMGNVELLPLSLGDNPPPRVKKSLDNIQHALSQIALFTESLLRSRHPAGQRIEINLNEFLQNQLAFLRPQKRLKKIVIQTEWGEGIPPLECDAAGLQQVFYNLMLNAADALAECGPGHHTVKISTGFDKPASAARLIVDDDGSGIPEELKSRLFKERVSTKPSGHGFGLLTVARIIHEHNGSIAIATREGGGAQFTICLPVSSPHSL